MAGRATAKFRVCLWRPKGDALLHSARFVARNPVHLDADEARTSPLVELFETLADLARGADPVVKRQQEWLQFAAVDHRVEDLLGGAPHAGWVIGA